MLPSIQGNRYGLVLRTIRGTEWKDFVDYVSPSFLEVVPLRHLTSQATELVSNAANARRFQRTRSDVARRLRDLEIPVGLAASPSGVPPQSAAACRDLGRRALEIYFAQLMNGDTTILDLRGARFGAISGHTDRWSWAPRPFYLRWEDTFLAGVRDLYAGFYRGEDDRFRRGLEALDLEAAEDVFLEHFGGGDQRVRFETRVFHSTFHEVFVRCRDAGVSLHRNFLPLGVYLASLYDLLEPLDLEFDVRQAFERAEA